MASWADIESSVLGVASYVTGLPESQIRQSIIDWAVSQVSDHAKSTIRRIEIRTAFSEPLIYSGNDVADLISGGGSSAADDSVLAKIKPTVIIETTSGRQIIAPGGIVAADEYKKTQMKFALGAAGVLGAAFFVGFLVGRR